MGFSWQFGATLAMLAATLAASRWAESRPPEALARPLDQIGRRIDGWNCVSDKQLNADVMRVLRPTSYLSRTYTKDDRMLGLFIAYYAEQRAGESMHSPKNCLPGSGWEIQDSGRVRIRAAGRTFEINRHTIWNGTRRMHVLYWYQSRGRVIASEYSGKLHLMWDAIRDARTAGSIVRVTTPDTENAADVEEPFAARIILEMQRCLGG